MDARRIDIFFYGLFMDIELLRAKGLDPHNPRIGWVHGMALRIGKRAALTVSPGATCPGIVMQLTHREIERLYADPNVALYRPEAVQCELADGTSVSALCFNLPEPPAAAETNPEYAERLHALTRRLGLTDPE